MPIFTTFTAADLTVLSYPTKTSQVSKYIITIVGSFDVGFTTFNVTLNILNEKYKYAIEESSFNFKAFFILEDIIIYSS